ncbi:MAG: hypothetical protein Q4D38_00890 [Planctomycetia bacterium]|nr:hypothetical protein [Planctomycetia bacterium]
MLTKRNHRKSRRPGCRSGVLSFEWILLCVLLVIGIIGGLAATRDAFLHEIVDTIEVVDRIDAEFVKAPTTTP